MLDPAGDRRVVSGAHLKELGGSVYCTDDSYKQGGEGAAERCHMGASFEIEVRYGLPEHVERVQRVAEGQRAGVARDARLLRDSGLFAH